MRSASGMLNLHSKETTLAAHPTDLVSGADWQHAQGEDTVKAYNTVRASLIAGMRCCPAAQPILKQASVPLGWDSSGGGLT